MKTLLTFLMIFASLVVRGQEQFKIYEKEITIPTYLVDEPDKVPYFYTGRAYQGAQGRIYPYAFDGNLTDEKEDVVYKGLFMENKFLEICVLPELGGRLYYMIDKSNGYNVIYRNNVIKPSMIGMLGAWISGGIEWNVPHHHRASTFMPTDYELVENDDGSKTIWVGELEIRHQVRWMVGLTMFPDNSIVKVDIKYINQTPQAHSFLIWANTAIHTNENYQVIFPPKTEYATFHRKVDFTGWPISNELYRGYKFDSVDISMWKNTPEGGSFFAWEDHGQFVAGIDHGARAGICVVGNNNIVIGKKLWTWGTSSRAEMWEEILTDDDGPYIEIMTGAYSNNQPDYSWCHPYFTKEATMFFMPIKGMNSVKESTLDAAINFEMVDERKVLVEINAYTEFKDVLIVVKNGKKTIYAANASLSPARSRGFTIDVLEGTSYYDLSVEVRSKDDKTLVSYHPQKKAGNPIPETVKPAMAPGEIETVEELVFAGLRLEQIYNPLVYPLPYYQEAVLREPNNAFANLRIGSWYLKEGMFKKAEEHLQRTTDRWTTDYTRSKDCEAFYLLGLTKLALSKEQEAYDNFYRATWDYEWFGASHLQLAMLESKNGHFHKALDHIEKALSVNTNNIRANEIKLSLLRKMNMDENAIYQLANLVGMDPLNLYVQGEKLLMGESDKEFFTEKMRSEIQNYLDLAVKFGNCGMYNEAITILKLAAEHTNPIVNGNALIYYYHGYYELLLGNEQLSNQSYQKAAGLNTDYCFPFRYETEKVLANAIEQNPDDYKAWYYWGNLLYDHQPGLAVEKWVRAIEINDEFAIAHRNLAFAADHFENDTQKAKNHIEIAIRNDATEPIYFFEQDNYSVKLGIDPEVRLANLEKAGSVIDHKDNSMARKVYLEMLVGSVDSALQILENHHFRKVEGVGNIHNAWVNACLIKGKELLALGEEDEALKYFEQSLKYPRNLDIGQNNREGQSHYFIGLALEKSGKKKLAKNHFQQSVTMGFNDNELYFKGLAYAKLGEQENADGVYNDLIKKGDELIKKIGESDYFSMFGNQSSENVRLAVAYSLQGLGYWGLNQKDKAESLFTDALKEDPSNFEAKTRLFD